MSAVVADYDDSSAESVRSRMISAMLRKDPVRIAPVAESDPIIRSSDHPIVQDRIWAKEQAKLQA